MNHSSTSDDLLHDSIPSHLEQRTEPSHKHTHIQNEMHNQNILGKKTRVLIRPFTKTFHELFKTDVACSVTSVTISLISVPMNLFAFSPIIQSSLTVSASVSMSVLLHGTASPDRPELVFWSAGLHQQPRLHSAPDCSPTRANQPQT